MSPIQKLINSLTGNESKPKAEILEVTCEACGHEFSVTTNQESDKDEPWRTDDETSSTSGDPEDGDDSDSDDDDDDYEDSMQTPKSNADKQSAIAKSLLEVTKDRNSVGAKAHEVSPAKSVEIVKNTKKIVEGTPADLLANALKKLAKESRK
jgi:hypothetical protein